MTDDDRKPGGGAWDLIEDLAAEDEIERRRAMPAEKRREAMKAQGLDPDRAHAVATDVLKKLGLETPPKVVHLAAEREKRRPARPAWVLALVAAAALVVLVGGGGAIVALSGPAPSATTPAPPIPTAPQGPSPEQLAQQQRAKADELRKVAAEECGAEKWGACYSHLGDAARLDPQGNEAWRVKRMLGKASRGLTGDEIEVKQAGGTRSLPPRARTDFVDGLAASKGQALRVVCVQGAEAAHLCSQLVAAITSAGWVVTRTNVPADAGVPHGVLIEVARDADDATQAAADVLAASLEMGTVAVRGPNDAPPGGDAPLRMTIGPQ